MTRDHGTTPATTPGSGAGAIIGWQEAVARLAAERTRAETWAALLKKHGDAAAIDRGALAYGEAKAEVDGIIAGLVIALSQREAPTSLPDLEARLERAVRAGAALADLTRPLVAPATAGEKGLVADLVKEVVSGAVGPLVEAVRAIWLARGEADRLTRATIQTQLDAARWPAFATITPSA